MITSLLKQLIRLLKEIPCDLMTKYDEVKSGSPRPLRSVFVDLFIKYASQGSFIVLFDAFDECDQRGIVLSEIIRPMYNAGIRTFITHRHHVLQNPNADFEDICVTEIRAQGEDIEKYIGQQLELEENSRRLSETFKASIISEIRRHAQDM